MQVDMDIAEDIAVNAEEKKANTDILCAEIRADISVYEDTLHVVKTIQEDSAQTILRKRQEAMEVNSKHVQAILADLRLEAPASTITRSKWNDEWPTEFETKLREKVALVEKGEGFEQGSLAVLLLMDVATRSEAVLKKLGPLAGQDLLCYSD
jgi:hypothetical protein